ncbi:MAG TPA: sugar phosphate isomerase/epimerase [Opitutaceae bacterium]|nr:sugar phosphate isomerase/epimerase [Opitutaceae bacterium]
MKKIILLLSLTAFSASASVIDHLGLQMYSLRVTAKEKEMNAALDQAKDFGFKYIEGGAPQKGTTIEQAKADLASRGLKMVSAGFGYEKLSSDLAGCVEQAKELGVEFVMISWIPHEGDTFTEAQAEKAVKDFNKWGAAFKAAGIQLVYHPHGYEFKPRPDGSTLFDVIAQGTKADVFNFEMDVFWATHGGQDPVKLLTKYPDRFKMMHVKDIRKGAPTGIYTGHAPETDDVPVGTGQVDWPTLLRKAQEVGVKWYFIEDESPTPLKNIPESVAYLKSLGI